MGSGKSLWLSDQTCSAQANASDKEKKTAYFGFKSVPADEKAQWVLRHFNSVARQYDVMNTILSFGIHYQWKRTALRMLGLKAGDRVLDVCGGTGDLALLASKAVRSSGQVVLYDINRAMIESGRRKRNGSPARDPLAYVQGDAEKISFPDSYFDGTMVGFGIRNVTRMEEGFKEMYRVLKPGGKLMCLEFSKPTNPVFRWLYDFYSFHIMPFLGEAIVGSRQAYLHLPESIRTFPLPDELSAILRRIGFARVSHRKLTNGIAVIHLAEKSF